MKITMAIAAAVLALALAAGCATRADEAPFVAGEAGSQAPSTTRRTTTTERTSTTRPTTTTTTTTAPPTTTTTEREGFVVGDRIETSGGDSVQVFAYEQPVPPPDEFTTPSPGMEWAVIDVEACAGPTDDDTGLRAVNPFDFELRMPDNTRISADFAVREPALNHVDLPYANDCARGFVSFQVPAGQRPRAVEDIVTEPPIRWTVP
jgi:hypothetical protein